MGNYKLSQEILENLRREHKKTREKSAADRLKARVFFSEVCGRSATWRKSE
ncbi:MAG: hypothetical protein Q4C96_01740 [Planctomycetia bacterium]|nr:hypothetical protein [Planctomycetia bacterium]